MKFETDPVLDPMRICRLIQTLRNKVVMSPDRKMLKISTAKFYCKREMSEKNIREISLGNLYADFTTWFQNRKLPGTYLLRLVLEVCGLGTINSLVFFFNYTSLSQVPRMVVFGVILIFGLS